MGAPERKAMMESEKMKQEETSTVEVAESPKDLTWAQFIHDSQYFDFSAISPKGLFTPRLESPNGFPDLGSFCLSPMYTEHLNSFLQTWSPRPAQTNTSEPESAPTVASESAPSVSRELKQIQSLDLSRVSNSEPGVSNSVTTSCESEGPCSSGDVKPAQSCAESASAEAGTKTRKRKPPLRDVEVLDDVEDGEDEVNSDADEIEDSKDNVRKPSRSKQQKVKGPKRLREPRYAIKTRTEVDIMEDGYKWRKYGQKPVKNSPHPRNYYRCTTANCPVRKRVERSIDDPGLVVTSYEGTHTHPKVNQPKRTASGNFAPLEAAESLSETLTQLQNRQQQAAASASSVAPPPFPQLPNLFPGFSTGFSAGWPSLMNRQMTQMPQIPPAGSLSALQDNVGLMMAYQIVRLQWELQAKAQQFMNYTAQTSGGGFPGGLPKVNPFMDPFGFMQGQNLGLPDMTTMMQSLQGENSDSDVEMERLKANFPKVPEALSSGSGSLLARRAAAQRAGSPLNPNLQSNAAKMQQLLAQAMTGMQHAALQEQQEQERLQGEGHGVDQGHS